MVGQPEGLELVHGKDDLGQRSLFLLLLTATVELVLYSAFKFLKYLVVGSRRG